MGRLGQQVSQHQEQEALSVMAARAQLAPWREEAGSLVPLAPTAKVVLLGLRAQVVELAKVLLVLRPQLLSRGPQVRGELQIWLILPT